MSVECTVTDGVATILLNRPDKLNALTYQMWEQMAEHLDRCQRDDAVRAIILCGAGRGFCAGADISGQGGKKDRKTGIAGTLASMSEYNAVIRRLHGLDKPIIAAIHGACVGIAWTMTLCCDSVLVTESASFRPAFLNLAKVPEGGIVYLMSRLVGQLKARDILYRARIVSGGEAVELGLATRLVAEDKLMDEARSLAGELAAGPPLALALTKRLFNSEPATFEQFLAMEQNAIAIAANTSDAVEGMAAFREKRAPKYTGR